MVVYEPQKTDSGAYYPTSATGTLKQILFIYNPYYSLDIFPKIFELLSCWLDHCSYSNTTDPGLGCLGCLQTEERNYLARGA